MLKSESHLLGSLIGATAVGAGTLVLAIVLGASTSWGAISYLTSGLVSFLILVLRQNKFRGEDLEPFRHQIAKHGFSEHR